MRQAAHLFAPPVAATNTICAQLHYLLVCLRLSPTAPVTTGLPFPGKTDPLMILNALAGKTIAGLWLDGQQIRDWLYVRIMPCVCIT